MGRKKKNTVFRYFDLTSQNGGAICLVNECRKLCKTQHSGNLLKYLQSHHKEQYNEVMELNKSREELKNTSQQNTVSKNVLRECTNLVAVHGCPFSMLKDKAFQNLISMIPGNTCTINAVNVRENIKTTASKLRYEIANELKDKMISLKIDIASLGTRSFMGINCQYIQKRQIVLKNLSTIEIFERHTSEHLKDLLIFNLNRFHIDLKHNKHIYEYFEDTEPIMDHSLNIDNDMIDQAFTTRITDVLHAQLICRVYENDDYEVGIVRCAAHTLQLALQDACKDAMTSNMLASCREVVRRLRTPKFVRIIRQDGKNMPKLDCATRWHSAIDVVESLLSLRDICNSHLELHLPNSTWTDAQEFVKCLIPAKVLTKKLQGEQLTVGDFYLSWLFCQFQLTKINSKLATDIVEPMKSRQKLLFENDIFINGVFLDPRVNSLLPPDQQKRAKENLAKLYIQYFKLEHGMKESSITDSTPTTSATSIEIKENVEAQHDLDDYLNSSYLQKHDDVGVLIGLNPQFDILNALQQSLNLFLDEPLLKATENVMIYWEKAKFSECKEKWRNIRFTFIRSTKQHPSGSKTKKPYYLSEHLTFILPYVKPVNKIPNRGNIPPNPEEETAPDTETADNIETEPGEHVSDEGPTDSSEQHQTTYSPVQSTATPVPGERRRKASSVEVDAAMIKFLKNKTNKADENILNKIEKQMNHFFLSLLPEFSDMNAQQIGSFKIKVLQLIDDIKTAPMSGPSRNSTGSSSRDNYSVYSPISSVSTPAPINQTEPPHAMNYQSLPANQYQAMNYQTEPQHAMTYQSESLPGYQDQAINFSASDDSFYQFHQIRENTE